MAKKTHTKKITKSKSDNLKSKYERNVAEIITKKLNKSINDIYEVKSFKYQQKPKSYTPDWQISENVYIETKGYLDTADRQKLILVKEQNPEITICLLLQTPNHKITKQSKTTYAEWAEKNGFKWSSGLTIPEEWFNL